MTPEEGQPAAKTRLRLWRRAILALVIVAVLAVAAEFALRAVIPGVIAGKIRESFSLADEHPVEVTLGGSALLPALTGRVNDVRVAVQDVRVLEGIEASLFASVDSVPFDPSTGDIVGATVAVKVPASSMGAIMSLATGGMVDQGDVRPGELIVGKTLQVFGYEVELSAGLAISVSDGDLLVEPTSLNAVGFELNVEDLRSLLGEDAAYLLDTHTVCVRDRLPAGITLRDVALSYTARGGAATVMVDIAPDILSNPKQLQPGSCPG